MPAQIYYLVGASGSGKDSLLQAVDDHPQLIQSVSIAKRFITRALHAGGEQHIELSPDEFEAKDQNGEFALAWQAHQQAYRYGIIHASLDPQKQGKHVLINGSRHYLPMAMQRLPGLRVIAIQANSDVLAARLEQRGRESTKEIQQRLQRATEYNHLLPENAVVIENNGDFKMAVNQLAGLLKQ